LTALFPTGLTVFLRAPAPVLLPAQVHPLVSFTSSSEYVAACHLPGTREHRAPSMGFVSSSRYEQVESTGRRVSQARLMFRPQRFSRSRRFTPPLTAAGLFHPATTSRICTPGVFPASQPARLINEPSPHVVDENPLPPSCLRGARFFRLACRGLIQAAIRCD
jgi:hypothetical protein